MKSKSIRRLFAVLLSAVMLIGLIPAIELTASADTWGGSYGNNGGYSISGTTISISSANGLAYIADQMVNGNYLTYTINLTADLNMNSIAFKGMTPYDNPFKGTFNGNGHKISNFKMDISDNRVGLFRKADGCTVKDITFTNVSINGTKTGTGVVAGLVDGNACTFSNIKVTNGTVTGNNRTGGIVGELNGSNVHVFTKCSNGATVMGSGADFGGIVGSRKVDKSVTYISCTNTGNIYGNYAGGIMGYNQGFSTCTDCTNSGTVETRSEGEAGGIIGKVQDDRQVFTRCKNSGAITAYGHAAGILGFVSSSSTPSEFYDCENTGTIKSTNNCAGGMLGKYAADLDKNIFRNCVNRGYVTASNRAGGMTGENQGHAEYTNCVNYADITATSSDAGGIGGYVADDEQWLTDCINYGTITSGSACGGGMIGYCGDSAAGTFTRCFNFGSVTCGNHGGGIIGGEDWGSPAGQVTYCMNWGDVSANGNGGGIVGNGNWLDVRHCFNKGNIKKRDNNTGYSVGGIVGDDSNAVVNCYNTGTVRYGDYAAGMVGYKAYGDGIVNSYNAGSISNGSNNYQIYGNSSTSDTNNYYLSSASGTARSGETAKTAAQLQASDMPGLLNSSYFVQDTWGVNSKYPIHKWWRDGYFYFTANFTDGGSTVSSERRLYNNTITAPTRSRTGYTFNGWYNGNTRITGSGGSLTAGVTAPMNTTSLSRAADTATWEGSVTYTANWTANKYTVTLDNQSAGTAGTASVQATYDSAMPSITVPTKTGYTFGGYYDQTGGGGTQYYTASGTSARTWNKAADTTLYAKWTAKTYTVSLDNQSATSAGTTTVIATYGAAMPAATMPTKTGYTFGGYYDQTGGEGNQYYTAAGASARTWNKDSAYTLYAKWTAIPYTVTVTPGTGVTVSGVTAGTYDYGATFTVTVAAQPAYNKSTPKLYVNGTETASGSVITVTGDTAITTNSLEPNKYTVRFFDKNEHEMAVYTQQVSHGSDATPPPAQNGYTDGLAHYTFDGWSGYTGITADTDIYASFTRTEHVFDQQNTDEFYLKKAATCTAPAQYYYSCVCGVRTSSYFEYGSAQGHGMTPTAAKPATCTEPGNSAYWYCGRCQKYFSDADGNNAINEGSWIISATGHETYVEGAWTWTPVEGGGYTATVQVTCAKGDDTRTLTANVGLTEDVAAQHLVDGHKKYTATASIGNQTFTDEKTDVIKAEGHTTVHHDAVPSAKCTETGTIEYWSCAGCDKLFSDAEAQNVITSISDGVYGDHAYAFSTFVWAADGKTAQAKYVCGNNTDHIDLRTAAMSEDAHAPTCTADGYTDYTASYDGHTDTNRVAGDAATGHETYVAGEWTWTPKEGGGYTATVAVDCSKEDDPRTLTAVVELTDSKDVTHLEDGYKTYTATATIGNQTFTDEKTDTIYAEGHTTVHHDAVHSTKCTETGTVEYWSCEGCEMLFSDAEAQNVITSISDGVYGDHAYAFDSFVWAADGKTAQAKYICGNNAEHVDLKDAEMSEDAHAPTCTAAGYTDYTATYDGHTDTNCVAGDAATGHKTYVEGEWTWTPKEGGGYTATVEVNCSEGDDPRTLTAVVEMTDSKDVTHLEDGYKTFTATATIGNQTFTATKTDVIEAEGHTTVHHDAVPSTKCTETGTIEYWSCEGCDLLFSDADAQNVITNISDGTYGAHAYAFSTFVWAADGTTAQAKYVCGNDEEHIDLRDAEMSEESFGASCTAGGYTVFTATYDGHTDTNRVDGSAASGHVYAAPSEDDWTWTKTEDGYDATVVIACVREDDTQTLTAVVELTENVAAQHLEDGRKKYTATASIGDQTFTAEKTDVIEAEGHTTVHHDAVPSAKCTETGTIEYWSCTGCDMLFSDADAQNTITNLSDGTYGNHAYAFDSFVWAADGKTAQAKYICGNNAEHVDLKDAEMSEDAHTPTCTAAGYTDYTATYDGHTDTNRVAGDAATGHETYVAGEWTWTPVEGGGYTATVAVDCAKEDDPRTLTANVELTDSKDVTHLEDGYKTYTATAIIGDQTFTDEKTDVIKAEGHTTVHHDAVPSAKCTETGTIEYWSCEGCDKLFSDAEAQNVITSISDGIYGEHAYGEWTKINESKHQRVCANDPDHVETEGHAWDNGEETLAPSCTSSGTVTYHCTKCDATKTATLDALGHKWNKGEVTKPATTTETGERTYTCERCGETRVETIARAGACKVCGAAHNKNLLDRLLGLIHAIWYYFLILDRTF